MLVLDDKVGKPGRRRRFWKRTRWNFSKTAAWKVRNGAGGYRVLFCAGSLTSFRIHNVDYMTSLPCHSEIDDTPRISYRKRGRVEFQMICIIRQLSRFGCGRPLPEPL
jgi:hypothetical protein